VGVGGANDVSFGADMGYTLYFTPPEEDKMGSKFEDYVRDTEGQLTEEERRLADAARARFRIGTRILQRRLAAGMTQQQLAAASGIAQADISRIEHGQTNPTTDTLEAIARPLGAALDFVPSNTFSEPVEA
jgi:ribosome-binding protein aMBF1 (putative translation factor)